MSGMSVRGDVIRELRHMAQLAINNEFITRGRVVKLERKVEDLIEALQQLKVLPEPKPEEPLTTGQNALDSAKDLNV